MRILHLLVSLAIVLATHSLPAQDTFSIVAVDSLTGEVGSAGASCISADNLQLFFPGIAPDFLGDLVPGRGAINTQSFYSQVNQANARERLLQGDSPQEIIAWLQANDAQGNSTQRQYGVAALQNGSPQSAAFTGPNCFDWKGHRTGPNYSIQGNILLGPEILDSMEARFLNTAGCLSDKLMAAMQGAKVPGADTRCLGNGTSAMFAFIKVAKPDDAPENPSLRLFVSYNPLGIEPIDSLQALYDLSAPCVVGTAEKKGHFSFRAAPNPSTGEVALLYPPALGAVRLDVLDLQGRLIRTFPAVYPGELLQIRHNGLVLLRATDRHGKSKVQMLQLRP